MRTLLLAILITSCFTRETQYPKGWNKPPKGYVYCEDGKLYNYDSLMKATNKYYKIERARLY